MSIEIERRFLVVGDGWRDGEAGSHIRQGYLTRAGGEAVVRVRRLAAAAFITVKSRADGASRLEFEYEVPLADADEMLAKLCRHPIIEKTRFARRVAGTDWVIDEYQGLNAGLIVAEAELTDPRAIIVLPPWVGRELTDDVRFGNSHLAFSPIRTWLPAALA